MDWFTNATKTMNNGLHNDSTLKETSLILFSGCAKINPNKLEELTACMLPEEAFSNKKHPGLNTVVNFLEKQLQNIKTAAMRK